MLTTTAARNHLTLTAPLLSALLVEIIETRMTSDAQPAVDAWVAGMTTAAAILLAGPDDKVGDSVIIAQAITDAVSDYLAPKEPGETGAHVDEITEYLISRYAS